MPKVGDAAMLVMVGGRFACGVGVVGVVGELLPLPPHATVLITAPAAKTHRAMKTHRTIGNSRLFLG
jgi:hypothetical protein